MRQFAAVFFVFVLMIGLPFAAQAQSKSQYPIGEVVEIEGKSYYKSPAGDQKRIRPGDQIYMNSVIKTDPDSKILILFIDDTQLTLAEKTELVIDEYVFDPYDPGENEGKFLITGGAFRWVSGLITKSERPNVKIKTGVGSIGIRGTDFWAGHIDDGYGVAVEEGLVSFDGNWGELSNPAGDAAYIANDSEEPGDAHPWDAARKSRAFNKTTFVSAKYLHEHMQDLMRENIRKRHDYRARVFPYKPGPSKGYRKTDEEFFTDEFLDMRDNLGRDDYKQ